MRSGGLILLFLVGIGIVGSYRAFSRPTGKLARWHAIVFVGMPIVFWFALEKRSPNPSIYFVAPAVLIGWGHWLLSGVEVYNSTKPYSESSPFQDYIRWLLCVVGLALLLVVVMYFIRGKT